MKRLFLVFCCIATVYSIPARADDGPFLDYAIEDSAPADITTTSVSMNMDAGAANVSTFDIAGIMLGMPFEDVQTLFFKGELHLLRSNTGETITVYFTSNATDNLVWRVVYKNDVDELEGSAEKFENQRQKKILAFWQNVLDKYGAPNSGTDKWITTSNAYDPMMTAYYGALDLVDQGRNASDQAKNINDARENFKAKPYAF